MPGSKAIAGVKVRTTFDGARSWRYLDQDARAPPHSRDPHWAAIVAAMNQLPVLYSFRRCPYAIRARMTIAYAAIKVELREVVLKQKPAALLSVSPKATVPVLRLPGGEVHEESLDIMRWALKHSDPEGWLTAYALRSEECKQPSSTAPGPAELVAHNDGNFKHWLDRYKYADRFPERPASWYREQGEQFLQVLESRLEQSPWLSGQRRGFADTAIFPFLRQFSMVDAQWFAASPYPRLRDWLHGQLESPLFKAVMHKYPPWEPGQNSIYFPGTTR